MRFAVLPPQLRPLRRYRRPDRAGAATPRRSGWDGFFIWDHIQLDGADTGPIVDPWVALTAVADATSTLRIGTMITPLARRRPWKLARETVTLDRISQRPADTRRRPRLPARGRVRDLRRGDRRPRPGGRSSTRGSRSSTASGAARSSTTTASTTRSPAPSSCRGRSRSRGSRSGAAAGGPTNARSAAPRAGTASRPSWPLPGGPRPPSQVAEIAAYVEGARGPRPLRHRRQRLLGAGRRARGGLDRRVRGRRPHLVAGAHRHRPTFLIRPSTTASPRWPPKRR